jgi:hypothetical protein
MKLFVLLNTYFSRKPEEPCNKETRAVEEIIGGPFMKKNLAEYELEISKKAS